MTRKADTPDLLPKPEPSSSPALAAFLIAPPKIFVRLRLWRDQLGLKKFGLEQSA